jgi:type II secretory pathway component PulJ
MSERRRNKSGGFVLMEIMLALGLLMIFSIIATKVIVTSLKVLKQSGEQHDQIVRFDSAMAMLRRDAWSARQVSSAEPNTLSIMHDDSAITWSIEKNSVVRKAADAHTSQRWELEAKLSFSVTSPTLTVSVQDAGGQSGRIEMISPLLLTAQNP